jgi:hypothetical protein
MESNNQQLKDNLKIKIATIEDKDHILYLME